MGKAKILIVEDEPLVSRDIQNMLARLDYEVTAVVPAGEEALEKIEEDSPDVVLMDIVLRGKLDGIATAVKIKDVYDIPVIFVTAFADDKTLDRAKAADPFGYLLKPFDQRELKAVIELALDKREKFKSLIQTAIYDPLTGLPNKMLFLDRFLVAMELAERRRQKIAVLLLGIEPAKTINTPAPAGFEDGLTKAVAGILAKIARRSDTIAKLVSGEFMLLLLDLKHEDQVSRVVQRIRVAFEKPLEWNGLEVALSLRIGASIYPDDGPDVNQLLRKA
jgi:diguanylate cyclase (GGDEF)-like protein